MHGFEDADTGQEHIALVLGDLESVDAALCRVHSECLTGDCLFRMRCDCGSQLEPRDAGYSRKWLRCESIPATGRARHWSDQQAPQAYEAAGQGRRTQ